MGQLTGTDLRAVEIIGGHLWQLATGRSLADNAVLLRELPDLTVHGTRFRAEFRLQADRWGPFEDPQERTMVVVRFAPPSPAAMPADPWMLCARVDWPARTDRLSRLNPKLERRLRKELSPMGVARDKPAGRWDRSQDIWLPPEVGRTKVTESDVAAQVGLFLIQTGLLDEVGQSDVASSLTTYLRGRCHLGEQVAQAILPQLLSNHWWSPGCRSWRSYIRSCAYYAGRRDRIEFVPQQRRSWPDLVSVDQLHDATGIARSTLYSWISKGAIRTTKREGRLLIPKDEVTRLRDMSRRVSREDVIRSLIESHGLTREAARKRVYRQECRGRSLQEISLQARRNHA
jgi:hypothetical protein